jgi:hypothetical protein
VHASHLSDGAKGRKQNQQQARRPHVMQPAQARGEGVRSSVTLDSLQKQSVVLQHSCRIQHAVPRCIVQRGEMLPSALPCSGSECSSLLDSTRYNQGHLSRLPYCRKIKQ